jgi:hypothetical protein
MALQEADCMSPAIGNLRLHAGRLKMHDDDFGQLGLILDYKNQWFGFGAHWRDEESYLESNP